MFSSSCVSYDEFKASNSGFLEDTDNPQKVLKDIQASTGSTKHGEIKIDWVDCSRPSSKSTVLIFHEESEAGKNFCTKPSSQVFLSRNLSFLAIYSQSVSEENVYGSDEELAAVRQFISKKGKNLVGFWSIGSKSILASRYVKGLSFDWGIYTDGIFDMEAALDSGEASQFIQSYKADDGRLSDDELEKRSIAWDYEGLPSKIVINHDAKASSMLKLQAAEFQKVLSAGGITSKLLVGRAEDFKDSSKMRVSTIVTSLKYFQN